MCEPPRIKYYISHEDMSKIDNLIEMYNLKTDNADSGSADESNSERQEIRDFSHVGYWS